MQITVNGEGKTYTPPLTVAGLLAQLKVEPSQIAVEHNRAVLPRSLHGVTALQEGDIIEIVRIIGGG